MVYFINFYSELKKCFEYYFKTKWEFFFKDINSRDSNNFFYYSLYSRFYLLFLTVYILSSLYGVNKNIIIILKIIFLSALIGKNIFNILNICNFLKANAKLPKDINKFFYYFLVFLDSFFSIFLIIVGFCKLEIIQEFFFKPAGCTGPYADINNSPGRGFYTESGDFPAPALNDQKKVLLLAGPPLKTAANCGLIAGKIAG